MHQNSLEAFGQLDITVREEMILGVYRRNGRATDREVSHALGFGENLNAVRPRITEMVSGKRGKRKIAVMLEEVGKKKERGISVRCCGIKVAQQELFEVAV